MAIPDTLPQEIWRIVCSQTDFTEAIRLSAPVLIPHFPLDTILVRGIEPADSSIVTAGWESLSAGLRFPLLKTDGSREQIGRLLEWASNGEILRHADADAARRHLPGVLPDGLHGAVLAGPLIHRGEVLGVLLLASASGRSFADSHCRTFATLLEPFSVALANSRRFAELARFREAAEANNLTLLSKLDRQDISDSIIGAETGLRQVVRAIEQVGRSDAPVLLLGETGSGKEVAARTIHNGSRRAAGPFLKVNCGAIPMELVDSQLFGHERGSFTGATGNRKGWFERADGGTLFLDEIGELPQAAQVRLLRILQDGTYERVGGQKQLRVDVRVVAATHRNLQQMAARGTFRKDLWYRIAVFPIVIPPLRERTEDIAPLATHFALRAARRLGTPLLTPTQEDVRLLMAYSWPGNIRELAAVIERAVLLGDKRRLAVGQALGLEGAVGIREPLPAGDREAGTEGCTGFATLDEMMRRHIEEALRRARGRVEGGEGAARLLAINPHTLRARMRKLGIRWSEFRRP